MEYLTRAMRLELPLTTLTTIEIAGRRIAVFGGRGGQGRIPGTPDQSGNYQELEIIAGVRAAFHPDQRPDRCRIRAVRELGPASRGITG